MKKLWLLLIGIAVFCVAVGLIFVGKVIFSKESQSETVALIDYTKEGQKSVIKYAPPDVHKPTEGAHTPKFVQIYDLQLDKAMTFNPEKGEKGIITYTLKEPARVVIKVVKEGTRELYLATILNMEFRDKGTHTETWDGLDYSGKPIDMTKASMFISAVAESSFSPGKMPLEKLSPEEVVHGKPGEWGHDHAHHHEWAEEVPVLKILNVRENAVLSGKVLIKSEVDKEKRGYGNQYGYGVRYYVDNVLAHEEFYKPESDGEFAYELDTTAFEDGGHVLYVGMCDHNEHTTSAGVRVKFDNSTKDIK